MQGKQAIAGAGQRERLRTPEGVELRSFPEFGAWFGVENETLLVAPMLVDGSVELGNLGEVEEFGEPPEFVAAMLAEFGLTFWHPDNLQPTIIPNPSPGSFPKWREQSPGFRAAVAASAVAQRKASDRAAALQPTPVEPERVRHQVVLTRIYSDAARGCDDVSLLAELGRVEKYCETATVEERQSVAPWRNALTIEANERGVR